jgi:hypothetical protein
MSVEFTPSKRGRVLQLHELNYSYREIEKITGVSKLPHKKLLNGMKTTIPVNLFPIQVVLKLSTTASDVTFFGRSVSIDLSPIRPLLSTLGVSQNTKSEPLPMRLGIIVVSPFANPSSQLLQ